jgi:hypothetical protein
LNYTNSTNLKYQIYHMITGSTDLNPQAIIWSQVLPTLNPQATIWSQILPTLNPQAIIWSQVLSTLNPKAVKCNPIFYQPWIRIPKLHPLPTTSIPITTFRYLFPLPYTTTCTG